MLTQMNCMSFLKDCKLDNGFNTKYKYETKAWKNLNPLEGEMQNT